MNIVIDVSKETPTVAILAYLGKISKKMAAIVNVFKDTFIMTLSAPISVLSADQIIALNA